MSERYADKCEADPPLPGCWHCPECGGVVSDDGWCQWRCGRFSPPPADVKGDDNADE